MSSLFSRKASFFLVSLLIKRVPLKICLGKIVFKNEKGRIVFINQVGCIEQFSLKH